MGTFGGLDPSAAQSADPTVSQDAFFTWAIGDGGADTVECSIDFAPFRDCIGSRAQTYDSTRISISDGGDLHTFSVRVTNPVSTATDTYAWTVRHLVTGLAVTPGDKNPTGPFVLTFALTDLSASAECRLDLGAFVRCTSPVTFPADPGAGSHTIIVRATNATGTDAQSIAWTFT